METQYISLNMTPSGVNPIFHISQYDVGRLLGFYVYNGSEVVDLDDYTCTVEATRTDGTQITTNVITNNNSGIFAVTATMSNVADKYNCQLVIVDRNTNRVASLPFIMDVVTAALNGNDSSIYNDRTLYQQYNASMQAALANEANNRINADNLEKATRQSAVKTLQGNINSEASTRAAADAVLQGQIDNFVQLPSGSTAADAELVNIRVKADGTSAKTAGDAVRQQVGALKEDLGAILKVSNPLVMTNADAIIGSIENIIIPIKLYRGDKVKLKNIAFTSYPVTVQFISLTDEGLTYPNYKYHNVSVADTKSITLSQDDDINLSDLHFWGGYLAILPSVGGVKINYSTDNGTPIQICTFQSNIPTPTSVTKGEKYVTSQITGVPNGNVHFNMEITHKYGDTRNTLTVGLDGCDFTNIQDAIDNAYDSEENPVTIIVNPGIYPRFSMGNWNNPTLRYISIVGVNRDLCVIKDSSGQYATPPAEILTVGYIANLSFVATHEAVENGTIIESPSYAIHMDFGKQNVRFFNCYFESHQAPAVGIGMHSGEYIEFKQCKFVSMADNATVGQESVDQGALFIHTPTSANHDEPYEFWIEDCCMISENGAYGATFINHKGLAVDNDYTATYIKNMVRTKRKGYEKRVAVNLKPSLFSFGNNLDIMNYSTN